MGRPAVYSGAFAQRRSAVLPRHHGLAERSGFATLQASGYTVPVSALIVVCGVGTTAGAVWGLFHLHRGDHRRHMPEPGGAPGSEPALAGGHSRGRFYLLAGLFGGSITALMSALPPAWIQMLAGLALLGTIGGSLFQAVHQASERDAAVLTFGHRQRGDAGGNWLRLLGRGARRGELRRAIRAAPPVAGRASGRWRL